MPRFLGLPHQTCQEMCLVTRLKTVHRRPWGNLDDDRGGGGLQILIVENPSPDHQDLLSAVDFEEMAGRGHPCRHPSGPLPRRRHLHMGVNISNHAFKNTARRCSGSLIPAALACRQEANLQMLQDSNVTYSTGVRDAASIETAGLHRHATRVRAVPFYTQKREDSAMEAQGRVNWAGHT